MFRPTSNGDSKQAFSMVNGSPDLDVSNNGSLGYSSTVFSREDAEALLNEKFKAKSKFQYKERCEQMMGYIKKLRLCIKWYIEHEAHHILEKEVIQRTCDSAERKLIDTEMLMKTNEKEYNSIVAELKKKCISAEEKLENEKSEKLAAMDISRTEKEGRVAAEKMCTALSGELEISQRDQQNSNQKISSMKDTYKRLQEYNTSLQQYNAKLQTELSALNGTLKRVEREKTSSIETINLLKSQHDALQSHLEASQCLQMETAKEKESMAAEVGRLRNELVVMQTDRDSHLLLLRSLTDEVAEFRECTGKSSAELDTLTLKSKNLEERCSSQSDHIMGLQEKLASMEDKLQSSAALRFETVRALEEQKRATGILQQKLADSESRILDGEKLRKTLHNTVLELKGNIRVFCRVRPLIRDDITGTESKPVVVSSPTSMEALGQGVELLHNGQKHLFTFDRVFRADASQEDVFVEITQLVQSALDGYKVCIFAYGQTGSGKTHTMMGAPEIPELRGLIPRSLEQIFATTHSLESRGWKYEMQVSMLEIYNETIRDLLSVRSGLDRQYTIGHDTDGNIRIPEMTVIDVHDTGEVSFLLERASLSRAVGRTNMNDQSSRSHFVFTLCLSGINENTEERVQGVLNLVDLAGSERLSRSGSTDERLRETQAINKSLSSLSDVIFALAKKEGHVPFRNSKLTRLLQPCLGGDSKTLMFVNVSPDPPSLNESLCSLRFASRVNACEIRSHRRRSRVRTPDHRLSYG